MPSLEHEALVQLFRNDRRLAAGLLRAAFDMGLPAVDGNVVEANVTQLVPAEYRADLVLAYGADVRVIVEVQLRKDENKRWTWPVYVAALRARDRCRVYLLVVTDSSEVARWARVPIGLGSPGSQVEPLVVGPGSFPRVTDPEQARKRPELAVLSALLRTGEEQDVEVAFAAIVGALGLDRQRAIVYGDLVLRSLGDAARRVLEVLMSTSPFEYEFKSEFALKYLQQGREEGREAGREEGREEGQERGRREATAQAILTVVSARGLPISESQRALIADCPELGRLETWLARAISVESVEELLRGAGSPA